MSRQTTATNWEKVGDNVKLSQTATKLMIEIDLTAEPSNSKSGKSLVVASTKGNARIAGGLSLGLNLYKPA